MILLYKFHLRSKYHGSSFLHLFSNATNIVCWLFSSYIRCDSIYVHFWKQGRHRASLILCLFSAFWSWWWQSVCVSVWLARLWLPVWRYTRSHGACHGGKSSHQDRHVFIDDKISDKIYECNEFQKLTLYFYYFINITFSWYEFSSAPSPQYRVKDFKVLDGIKNLCSFTKETVS